MNGARTFAWSLAWTACALAQAPPQAKPPASVQIEPLKEVEIKPRIGILGQTVISLPEVIQRVLENDRDLQISRIVLEEAGYNVSAAEGAYDPVAGLRAYRTRSVFPIASLIGGAADGKLTQKELNGTPELAGLFPSLGGSYNANFVNSRQLTDNQFVSLNPQYPNSVNLNLTQPLWRGLRLDENRHRLRVARKNKQLSAEQFRQRVIEIVTQAVDAYWELDFAWRNLEVQTEAVRLAERQYASNRRQAEQGMLAPIDVVAAQTQVATFEQYLFAAQQALTQAENNLKSLMLPNRSDLMWSAALIPQTQPSVSVKVPALEDAVQQALQSRPELAESAISIEVNKLDSRLSQEQAKPRIDAFANLSVAGLAGRPIPPGPNPLTAPADALVGRINQLSALAGLPPLPPISFGSSTVPALFVGSYGQSLSNLAAGNFPSAQVGVQFSFPLRNRTALAQAASSAAEGRRLRVQRDQIEMAIEADVRNALQAVTSAQSRLDAAVLAQRSADEQYASEQRQFQAGTTTVFFVLQRQSDLIIARSREVRARADLGEAIANLDRATARTIEAQKITLINP
ncbi:MAG TPA: TolC family protein [Bryobacteraceae bacterium]|nr:TolC family protein [Bryobacteraceae bacterium]